MITSDKQNSYVIQSIISAGNSLPAPSLTTIVNGLNKINQKLLPFIEDPENNDEIINEFYTARVNLAIEIGVNKPEERKNVIELISQIANSGTKLEGMQLITVINQSLSKMGVKYRIPVALSNNINAIAQKCLSIMLGITNINILNKRKFTEEVAVHVEKYIDKPTTFLEPLIVNLKNTLDQITNKASDPKTMLKIAEEMLLKIGYLQVSIKDKDPGQLANTIFFEMVAAQGVFNAKKTNKLESTTEDQAKDQIALILVNTLR